MTQSDDVEASYPAVPGSVPVARHAIVSVVSALGATPDVVDAVRLASSEALTNAVVHAYDGEPGLVHVSAGLDGARFTVTVADDGHGVMPRSPRRGMGVGLALIGDAAEEVTIVKRPTGGTAIVMRFAV